MKRNFIIVTLVLLSLAPSVWGLNTSITDKPADQKNTYLQKQKEVFRQSIPAIAKQFKGIPYQFGGNPLQSKTSDNSHLFFAIYKLAAQKAGLSYTEYMPMRNLLKNIREVNENDLQNGDLMLLNDDHAAMIYQIEDNGKIHLIYASEMRRQILIFHSENPVFHVYWLENLNGFYRLSDVLFDKADAR